MPIKLIVFLTLIAFSSTVYGQSSTERAENDEIHRVADEDADMQQAFEQARQGLQGFLAARRSPPSGTADFAVRVSLQDGDDTEYFWISPFHEEGDGFNGMLNNQPRTLRNVAMGDRISFTRAQIVDWFYYRKGEMVGNFTACAIIKRENEAARLSFEKHFGLRCEE